MSQQKTKYSECGKDVPYREGHPGLNRMWWPLYSVEANTKNKKQKTTCFPTVLPNQMGHWFFSKKPIAESRKNLFFSTKDYICFRDCHACRKRIVKNKNTKYWSSKAQQQFLHRKKCLLVALLLLTCESSNWGATVFWCF